MADLLNGPLDGMSPDDWAFALRWTAQGELAGAVAPRDEIHAIKCLLKAFKLGDVDAAWELASLVETQAPELHETLMDWAALHGSTNAMSWTRDRHPVQSNEWSNWDSKVERAFLERRMPALVVPPSALYRRVEHELLRQ